MTHTMKSTRDLLPKRKRHSKRWIVAENLIISRKYKSPLVALAIFDYRRRLLLTSFAAARAILKHIQMKTAT
jgi:hypothetical protein